jgi:hypothetical protein
LEEKSTVSILETVAKNNKIYKIKQLNLLKDNELEENSVRAKLAHTAEYQKHIINV